MSFREVKLVAVACDLCDDAGAPQRTHEEAESLASAVGITRFMNARHSCRTCREMLGKEVEKTKAAKAVTK